MPIDSRLSLALAPVSPGSADPGQGDRLDAALLALDDVWEIAAQSMRAEDWFAVASAAIDLLSREAKHLPTCGRLLVALTAAEGVSGFLLGVAILNGLCTADKVELLPVEDRRRGQHWATVRDLVPDFLAHRWKSQKQDEEAARRLAQALVDLDAVRRILEQAGGRTLPEHIARLMAQIRSLLPDLPAVPEPDVGPAPPPAPAPEPAPGNAHGLAADKPADADGPLPPLSGGFAGLDLDLPADAEDDDLSWWGQTTALIDGMSELDQNPPDWSGIAHRAQEVVLTKSRDLRVAGVGLMAAACVDLPQFLAASDLYRKLCVHHWGQVYPAALDDRTYPVGRMIDASELALRRLTQPKLLSAGQAILTVRRIGENLETAAKVIKGSDPTVRSRRLLSLAAALERLSALLREALSRVPLPEDRPPTHVGIQTTRMAAEPVSQAGVGPTAESQPTGKAATLARPGSLSALKTMLIGFINETLVQKEGVDAHAFALFRVAGMLTFPQMPQLDGSSRLLAPVTPSAEHRSALRVLVDDYDKRSPANTLQLLLQCEREMVSVPFWLDHHHAVAGILGRLGAEFAQAKAMVDGATMTLVRRFPHLPTAEFADGGPVAGPEARRWIATELTGGGDGGYVNPALDAARAALAQDDREGALALLHHAAQAARGGRDRLRARMDLAAVAVGAGLIDLAVGVLESLLDELDRRGLDDWEPELTATAIQQVLSLYDRARADLAAAAKRAAEWGDHSYPNLLTLARQQRAIDYHRRLSGLDPGATLKAPVDLSRTN